MPAIGQGLIVLYMKWALEDCGCMFVAKVDDAMLCGIEVLFVGLYTCMLCSMLFSRVEHHVVET